MGWECGARACPLTWCQAVAGTGQAAAPADSPTRAAHRQGWVRGHPAGAEVTVCAGLAGRLALPPRGAATLLLRGPDSHAHRPLPGACVWRSPLGSMRGCTKTPGGP